MNRLAKRGSLLLFFLSLTCLWTLGSYGCGSSDSNTLAGGAAGAGTNEPDPNPDPLINSSQSQSIYQACETNQECEADENCIEVKVSGELSGYCSQTCENVDSCPENAQDPDIEVSCIALEAGSSTNYCTASCEQDEDCLDGLTCQTDSNGTKICLAPQEKSGSYEACETSSDCQDTLVCVLTGHNNEDNVSPGYCANACNSAADCPDAPDGGNPVIFCVSFGGPQYCNLDCSDDGGSCPGGWSCETDGGLTSSSCLENI